MQVYINGKKPGDERQLVEVEVIRTRKTTILVRLPDGNIIERKKNRDLPKETEDPSVQEKPV